MSQNIVERLLEFNADRIPTMLALKYKNMRADAFTFFRGSCHLFYEDWPAGSNLNAAPLTWVCGDLHLENFGSFLGHNRLVYFDINDFDEGSLAPCTWDVTRFVTSLILAGNTEQLPEENIHKLCARFLDSYFSTLALGRIHNVERANATGLVKKLMRDLKTRQRRDFLNERSRKIKTTRKFKPEYASFLPATVPEQEMIKHLIKTLAEREKKPDFFKTHDVAFRIAGTGSLGIRRYAVLIEGGGSPDKNYILDIKETRPSALTPYLKTPQPNWENQAERVITIQKRLQAVSPDLLTCVEMQGKAFLVKEYQPQQDRINLADWASKPHQALELSATMAELLAWGELRSSGRQGSAIADDLIAFGRQVAIKAEIQDYAATYAKKVHTDFEQFAQAYDHGQFK